MSVLALIVLIFIGLTGLIFPKRALYFLTGLFINLLLFLSYIGFIHWKFPVYPVTIFIFLCIAAVILFYTNGWNAKTKVAFSCTVLFLVSFTLLIYPIVQLVQTQGFSVEELEELTSLDLKVAVPFQQLNLSLIILSFSGAVVDGSLAISSSTFEILTHNPQLSFIELLRSSQKVVQEILNSTIYTLLFAFLGSSLALVIWLQDLQYSFSQLINSKLLIGELTVSLLTGIAAVVILPLSALLGSYWFKKWQTEETEKS